MTLMDHFSNVFKKKICQLECTNQNQQIEIQTLKRKNACLHIRLAEALKPAVLRSCDECSRSKNENLMLRKILQEKLTYISRVAKVLKEDLRSLSEDVTNVSCTMDDSFKGFGWVVSEKLQDLQAYTDDINDSNMKVKHLEEALQLSQELYLKEKERRKELHNTLVQLRGNIRVHCRLRPVLDFDQQTSFDDTMSSEGEDNISSSTVESTEKIVHAVSDEAVSVVPSPGKPFKLYEFEKVYSDKDGQGMVSDEIKPLLTSFLDGYNVCVMAYGQTGSGKSHTMLGRIDQPGIVPRAAEELFRLLDERRLHDMVKFAVSVAEVYNNDIFDLLTDEGKREKHEIVTSGEGNKDVPTLHHVKVESADEIQTLLERGLERRAKMSTKVHEHSSRSHLIVTITATFSQHDDTSPSRSEPGTPRSRPQSAQDYMEGDEFAAAKRANRRQLPQPRLPQFSNQLTTSPRSLTSYSVPCSPVRMPLLATSFKTKLQFVDLAGSECVGMSGVTGSALRESSYINRSLSALADVLSALSEHRSHIPYRNSRLTHLLQDSIGGDAKMLVLLCVSPTRRYLTETLQCLGFGSRARQVQRGQTKRRGNVRVNHSESPSQHSPRQARPMSSVVRRVLN